MKKFLSSIAFLFVVGFLLAQQPIPVQLHYVVTRNADSTATLLISGSIEKGVKLISPVQKQGVPFLTTITLDNANSISSIKENAPALEEKSSVIEDAPVRYFTDSFNFKIDVLVKKGQPTIDGNLLLMWQKGNDFPTAKELFSLSLSSDNLETQGMPTVKSSDDFSHHSIWYILLKGLGAGLLALIFPCIYAMIPVTVSFFLKRSKTKQQGIKNAFSYSLSIILIFAVIGFIFGLTRNAGFANNFASSNIFNIFVFLLFVVFGISFLGAFDITLPASWTNKIDSKAHARNIFGIFFMALTLVVVSFSCTAPFISYFAVTPGLTLVERTVAFAGFGLGIALPFTLFALSPSLLNKLAKGGGWLNTLKVSFGFVELALALKFLSSADLSYHWRLLDREVYLALWIVIFGLLGFYLLGKLKLRHDDDLPQNDYGHPYLTVTRLFFAIAALSFTVYMIPGLWGAPLKGISAWIPESITQDFDLSRKMTLSAHDTPANTNNPKPIKYTSFLGSEIPGVVAFFDYDEALIAAKIANKPLMIDFTGHSCANCRRMEKDVLTDEYITKSLQNDFIVVSLYVDDKYMLPENEWYKSKTDTTRLIKRLGDKNLEFEVALTNNNAQPFYVFVDNDGKLLAESGYGYDPDIQKFRDHLTAVKDAFEKRAKK